MEINLELLKETILEMHETNNNNLLIERFSFEERIMILEKGIESLTNILEDIQIDIEDCISYFFSYEEVKGNFDAYKKSDLIMTTMLCSSYVSDQFKIEKMVNITDDYYKAYVIKNFKEDANKISCLSDTNDDRIKADIIKGFKEDSDKISGLSRITDDSYKAYIIKSFKEDVDKISVLSTITDNLYKARIIESFKEDADKISVLSTITDDRYKARIIESFKEDADKISVLSTIADDLYKARIIESFKEDSDKISLLNSITDDFAKASVIESFKEDADKISGLSSITDDRYRVDIIRIFKKDADKISCLSSITDDSYKAHVIGSFKEDANKIKYLSTIADNLYKARIIESFKEDADKISCLSSITDDHCKAYVIRSFKEDADKISCLSSITDDSYKARVIAIFKEDANKIKYLSTITDDSEKAYVIKGFKEDADKISCLSSITDDFAKASVIKSFKEDANKIEFLDVITDNYCKEEIIGTINNIEKQMTLFLQSNSIGALTLLIEHNDSVLNLNNINKEVVMEYSKKYDLNYENLYALTTKFGYEILRNVKNNNIVSLINLDKKDFEKMFQLFDLKGMAVQKHDIDNILNTLVQREFRIEQNEIVQVFPFLESIIEAKDKERFKLELLNIIGEIDVVNLFRENNMNVENLINGVFSDKNSSYLNILHEITNKYIAKKREDYSTKRINELFSSLNFEKAYEKNITIKKLFEIENLEEIIQLINTLDKSQLSQEAIQLIEEQNTLRECITYKKNPQSFSKEEFDFIKNRLKTLTEILNELYGQKKLNAFAERNNIDNLSYGMPKISNSNIISILREINFGIVKEKILDSDNDMYQKLLQIMKKYKFVLWGDVFEDVLNNVGLSLDSSMKASFINNFYSFYPNLELKIKNGEMKNISLSNLLDEVMAYGSNSFRYKCLLGGENYALICKNPGPNSSSLTVQDRLEEVPKYITKLYERHYITVPPVDKIINLDNSKEINVTVGNISDISNLTLGERTGACMRIGGAGGTLFDFCLENENGFHVIFTNPKTQKFVSRVSGFRNGNTVFLNQLRYSCDYEYSDEDLIEATKKLANYFIEKTKDSKTPINNIVISNGYAMEGNSEQSLGVENIKMGFNHFYSDVSSYAVLLATSNEDNSLVPVVLGPENTEKYAVLRSKVKSTSNPLEIKESISKIQQINQLLAGIPLDEVVFSNYDINFSGKLHYGEDWYVLLDDEGNVIEKYIMSRDEENMNLANEEIASLGLEMSKEENLNGGTKK